jgi:hypothetical protein
MISSKGLPQVSFRGTPAGMVAALPFYLDQIGSAANRKIGSAAKKELASW